MNNVKFVSVVAVILLLAAFDVSAKKEIKAGQGNIAMGV